jgi:glycosyltransferase involved in cell wall biosynthesis
MIADDSMYIVLPVPFRIADGRTFVEAQAANGLDRWADNFSRVVVAAPVIPDAEVHSLAGFVWRDVEALEHRARIVCQPLPWAYTPGAFVREFASTRRLMAASIREANHLQFAIGGLVGDWAAVAALEAITQRRNYAIHTDRVEHQLIRKTAIGASPLRRAKVAVEAPLMEIYHRHVIRHCSLGLWHGDDCYKAYAPWCRENHLVHDVHTKQTDLIDEQSLARKIDDIRTAKVLEVCYVGRLDPMKAPLEWLRAIATARDLGARLHATWYGEGALMDDAKAEASRLNLNEAVRFPGFVADRVELLANIRAAHALVFTHITPESPRNLLEALVSGTAILGYDNPYAVNLLDGRGGGQLVPIHDSQALGAIIADLARDSERLAEMTRQAAANGSRFTDTGVFAERSELVKRFA